MSWCWLALLPPGGEAASLPSDARPAGASAWAAATELDGSPAGQLTAWPRGGPPPVEGAVRVAADLIDPAGTPGTVSLLLLEAGPLNDDPAVSGALRAVLRGVPGVRAMSTAVRDSVHLAGSVLVADPGVPLAADPFRILGEVRLLDVAAGLLSARMPLPAPVIQRYAGKPWPACGFAQQ